MAAQGRWLKRLSRAFKYGSALLIGTGCVAVLKHNEYEISSLGVFRFGRAAITAAQIVADYKRSVEGVNVADDQYLSIKSKFHRRSAEKLRAMCCRNGGCFIKVGQHLASLEYLLPPEYIDVMKVLHSDAPQTPVSKLFAVLEEELGKPVEEVFAEISPQPLGTASLAQVHRATLHDGTEVAVKIQHPHVKEHAFVDMATMELLVRGVAWLFPDFRFLWLAEETKKNLPLELDFVHEAKNCERVAKMFSHFSFLKVPIIHWKTTTEKVLTMEYCPGGQVNDPQYMRKQQISVDDVSRKLGQLYSEMIFVQGYIHCDPHPGNVLVNKTSSGTQIVLLDHGLYQTLHDDFRLSYCAFWRSILEADVAGIEKYAKQMGIGRLFPLFACIVTARSWTAVSAGVDKQEFSAEEDNEIKDSAAQYLPEISQILNDIPREMLLILKTNDLLRGIESTLRTRANAASLLTMSKCCVRATADHERKQCASWFPRVAVTAREQWTLFTIVLYEFYLWFKGTSVGQTLNRRPLLLS